MVSDLEFVVNVCDAPSNSSFFATTVIEEIRDLTKLHADLATHFRECGRLANIF